ncbi:McrB family protein [Dietzia timorensis]|uniref:5-methylcytosine-specific restriction enzyme B n=1 Tax=Dietzia timorensis TaxID=499555 RepID=A0A173LHK4_9ACTN|nr:AAA family ATPase [Dietzia timorensis]ANI91363.1 5-methylcytosine-specific restriction enzyme B [Dietzia timorensis]
MTQDPTNANDVVQAEDGTTDSNPTDNTYYWYQSRDHSFTPSGVQLFQIACKYDGVELSTAKSQIDRDYNLLTGATSQNRHGGKFATAVLAYKEVGWIDTSSGTVRITDAGKQAEVLLSKVPDFLRVVPYFLVDLLADYQINHPGYPKVKNQALAEARGKSDIFPYWTIWKIMHDCDWRITTEELQRFVFKLKTADQIPNTVIQIKRFREDSHLSTAELDAKYPTPLTSTAAKEPKYWMGKAGAAIGDQPSLLSKPSYNEWEVSEAFRPFISHVVSTTPNFIDYVDEHSWALKHGEARRLLPDSNEEPYPSNELDETSTNTVQEVLELIYDGVRSILLSGPPGTGKSFIARRAVAELSESFNVKSLKVQFHPSFGYEDFVEGYVPTMTEDSHVPTFELQPKILKHAVRMCAEADYVVILIDELSRGDVGRIFGEAITYLEEDYRGEEFTLASGNSLTVPHNLIILATLNPFDRSVVSLDVALIRRFFTIPVRPNGEALQNFLVRGGLSNHVQNSIRSFFERAQEILPEGGLGHAHFKGADSRESLRRIWDYRLEPIISRQLAHKKADTDELRALFDQALIQSETTN